MANPPNWRCTRIAELQQAVSKNAESVRVLAEQMQRTIEAIEAAALSNERALQPNHDHQRVPRS